VDDSCPERQWRAGPAFRDGAAELLVRDVERAFCLLRREDAADGAGRDRRRPAAAERVRLPRACAESGGEEAAELDERATARDPLVVWGVSELVHAGTLGATSPSRLRSS